MFYQASSEAKPLLRAMWFEFPKDASLIGLDTQFMFGENILVCPKLAKPAPYPDSDEKVWSVNCTLPESSTWYNWYNRVVIPGTGLKQMSLPDNQ